MYQRINNENELQQFSKSICWDDSYVLELYASKENQDYFPSDINHSGYEYFNYHFLLKVCSAPTSHMELVFIDCSWLSADFINNPFINGYMNTNGKIHSINHLNEDKVITGAIIYRYINLHDLDAYGYFSNPQIIKPRKTCNDEGYSIVEIQDQSINILLVPISDTNSEITITQNDNTIKFLANAEKLIEISEMLKKG